MLVELGLVEQRDKAVMEVLDGATVIDVARRNGVARQTVHDWLRRYAAGGLAALVDGSSKPQSCPHQMAPEVEAAILELRRAHPGWGPRTIGHRLERNGVEPVPGRSSIYRCLVRHGLIDPQARRKRRSDYKRWERSRAMELWQMDIVGGVVLTGDPAFPLTGAGCEPLALRAAGRLTAWRSRRDVDPCGESQGGPPTRRHLRLLSPALIHRWSFACLSAGMPKGWSC